MHVKMERDETEASEGRYRARRERETEEQWQARLARRSEYDRRRYAAMTTEQRQRIQQPRHTEVQQPEVVDAPSSEVQKWFNKSIHRLLYFVIETFPF